jgi:hypothetical protein
LFHNNISLTEAQRSRSNPILVLRVLRVSVREKFSTKNDNR